MVSIALSINAAYREETDFKGHDRQLAPNSPAKPHADTPTHLHPSSVTPIMPPVSCRVLGSHSKRAVMPHWWSQGTRTGWQGWIRWTPPRKKEPLPLSAPECFSHNKSLHSHTVVPTNPQPHPEAHPGLTAHHFYPVKRKQDQELHSRSGLSSAPISVP